MNTAVIRILVAHGTMAGELLAEALKSSFTVVARATTAMEAMENIGATSADVALIAASLQDGHLGGFRALRGIRENYPDVRCVMLLERCDRELVVDAFRAGAKGVFSSAQSEFQLLRKCITAVHAGQVWANSHELNYLLDAFSSQPSPLQVQDVNGTQLLTKREEQVVRLLAEGLTNREIAKELSLSTHTIKNYLFRIFDKLGVSTRVELVMYAVNCTKMAATPVSTSQFSAKTVSYSNAS
jgi:DNA-binding NarL/FixJ family response regulator